MLVIREISTVSRFSEDTSKVDEFARNGENSEHTTPSVGQKLRNSWAFTTYRVMFGSDALIIFARCQNENMLIGPTGRV